MAGKLTHKDLESFYSNVDALCEEIFGVGTIYVDLAPEALKEENKAPLEREQELLQ